MTTLERTSGGHRSVVWTANTTSAAVNIESGSVFALYLPAAYDGTQVSFEAEASDGTWEPVHYDGTLLTASITAGARNILPEQIFCVAGGRIRFVSDEVETVEGRLYLVK